MEMGPLAINMIIGRSKLWMISIVQNASLGPELCFFEGFLFIYIYILISFANHTHNHSPPSPCQWPKCENTLFGMFHYSLLTPFLFFIHFVLVFFSHLHNPLKVAETSGHMLPVDAVTIAPFTFASITHTTSLLRLQWQQSNLYPINLIFLGSPFYWPRLPPRWRVSQTLPLDQM